jgi:tRNA pseudouridine38-40 synthase
LNKELVALLSSNQVSKKDASFFVQEPYYRNHKGELGSTFEDVKRLWSNNRIEDSFLCLEETSTVKYYRLTLKNGTKLDGKVVLNKEGIAYIYEDIADLEKTRYFCVVSYDGTLFEGYQKQVNKRTVQGEIEQALYEVFQTNIGIHASGRTDKGVHAYHQTFHFDGKTNVPTEKLKMVIGQYLPDDIFLKSVEEKPSVFHARYDTVSKTYMYHLDAGPYDVTKRNHRWYVDAFDVQVFKDALRSLIGRHDFASFTKTTEKQTVRTILDLFFVDKDKELKVFIRGDGFLRYMVRNLVMAAYLIACGKVDYTMVELAEKRDNRVLRQLADPAGLYLYDVAYE